MVTRTLVFYGFTAGAQIAWKADRDYVIKSVMSTGNGLLTTDPSGTYASVSSTDSPYLQHIHIHHGGSIFQQVVSMHIFIRKGTNLYWVNSVTNKGCSVILESST